MAEPKAFLQACRSKAASHRPVWFMRQAGRSLPEYRKLRGDGSILEAIGNPTLAAQITLQPVHRYGVDAAILFSDIVVPVAAIGFGIDIAPGKGPVVDQPISNKSDIKRLRDLEPDVDIAHVIETVKILVDQLGDIPLIGFCGGPFTVASYLIEGGPSRTHAKVKSMMHATPRLWDLLMQRLVSLSISFLTSQIQAGASAVQIFDSWIGSLSVSEYERFAKPAEQQIFDAIGHFGVPSILFGVGTGELLSSMATSGADVIGVDWRVTLDVARIRVGTSVALQGNLDPAICLAPEKIVQEETLRVLKQGGTQPGYIFNLGHGVLPETDPGILSFVVTLVHRESSKT